MSRTYIAEVNCLGTVKCASNEKMQCKIPVQRCTSLEKVDCLRGTAHALWREVPPLLTATPHPQVRRYENCLCVKNIKPGPPTVEDQTNDSKSETDDCYSMYDFSLKGSKMIFSRDANLLHIPLVNLTDAGVDKQNAVRMSALFCSARLTRKSCFNQFKGTYAQ